MSILVVAEHDNKDNKSATLVTIAAAQAIGGDIDVLVAGIGVDGVASQVASVPGVNKVLVADNAAYEHQLAENLGDLVAEIAAPYSHVMAPHTANGRSFLPRVAAKLGVAQISDIVSVESPDTFKRPIYAGNAIATVKSNDAVKVVSVRGTAYDAVASTGGSASIEAIANVTDAGVSSFVSQEIAESERPELTAASVTLGRVCRMAKFRHAGRHRRQAGAAIGAFAPRGRRLRAKRHALQTVKSSPGSVHCCGYLRSDSAFGRHEGQ